MGGYHNRSSYHEQLQTALITIESIFVLIDKIVKNPLYPPEEGVKVKKKSDQVQTSPSKWLFLAQPALYGNIMIYWKIRV